MLVATRLAPYTTHMPFRPEQLPLVSSIEETAKMWPKMNTIQKLGACAASIVTTAGPISRILIESHRSLNTSPSPAELIAELATDLRDGLDGKIARATDGVTPFGKEFDPFVDKIDFLIQEFYQNRRGELPLKHLVLRFGRDVLVTAIRAHIMDMSNGQANIGTGGCGKVSTSLRQASLRITGLPFEQSTPHIRTVHQTAATGLILYSGAQNVKNLLDERAKFLPEGHS